MICMAEPIKKKERRRMTEQTHKRRPQSYYAKVIGEYCYRAIERVKGSCEKKVNHLYEKFPYDGFAEKKLHQLLNREHIYEGQGCYADCVSAGMLAYIYSIHRCAYMGYANVEGYISKMLRIYILCAAVVYRDSDNLCKENAFRQIRIDQMERSCI